MPWGFTRTWYWLSVAWDWCTGPGMARSTGYSGLRKGQSFCNPPSQGAYGPRHEHDDDHQREYGLDHRQYLDPSGEHGRVGRAEGRAGGEGHEQVFRETRRPTDSPLAVVLVHLREQEVLAGVSLRSCARPVRQRRSPSTTPRISPRY